MTDQIYSVSDFLAVLNQSLEMAFPVVLIEGEVSSFKVNQGKFVFFDLKDSDGTVGCFMTLWQLRMPIEDGMKVVLRAVPKVTPWGKFSLTVQQIRPSGEGSLKKSFELLRANLEKEGLFAAERKRILPTVPSRVGVISSTQAAGYADFIKIIDERWGGLDVDVAHTQVQGQDAPDQIIRAIQYFNQQPELVDVLVIIRGGGSADDLSTFNDELLVREIARSRIPTLVGVGHEVDETLADLVADVRAATPSNAAQILVPDREEIIRSVRAQVRSMAVSTERAIEQIERDIRTEIALSYEVTMRRIDEWQQHNSQMQAALRAYDPRAVLRRGYALIRGEIDVGKELEIETAKQLIKAEVTHVQNSRQND